MENMAFSNIVGRPGLCRNKDFVECFFIGNFIFHHPVSIMQQTVADVKKCIIRFCKFCFVIQILTENLQENKI